MDQNTQLKNRIKVAEVETNNDQSCAVNMRSIPMHPPTPSNAVPSHPNSHVIPNIPLIPTLPPPLHVNKLWDSQAIKVCSKKDQGVDGIQCDKMSDEKDIHFITENSEPKQVKPVPKPRPKEVPSCDHTILMNENNNTGCWLRSGDDRGEVKEPNMVDYFDDNCWLVKN